MGSVRAARWTGSRAAAGLLGWTALMLTAGLACAPLSVHGQKYGGVLRGELRENPSTLSLHESQVLDVTWCLAPAFNNLVYYDPLKEHESLESIIPELAERWSWSKDGTRLTFTLRRGVKWHDGQPFTSADVKHTYDVVRGASAHKLRINPRRSWFWNVKSIDTNGDYEVTFALGTRQPALVTLLASGIVPVIPAHLDPGELRSKVVGTGPFRLKEYLPDQRLVFERNRDYFIPGRPYLDGIVFTVIRARPSRVAALSAGQQDLSSTGEPPTTFDPVKETVPGIVIRRHAGVTTNHLLVNAKRRPFDNAKLRQALNLALDRRDFIQSVGRGFALMGGVMLPPPQGRWGLPAKQLAGLDGYGDGAAAKERARRLMAELGYGPDKPLTTTILTRALDIYVDSAIWVAGQLKQIYVNATLQPLDSGEYIAQLYRKDYDLAVNWTAANVDDPDAVFFHQFLCNAEANFNDYCNPAVEKMIYAQSAEPDPAKRLALVHEIDRKLLADSARIVLQQGVFEMAYRPDVKNLVVHPGFYNFSRMQEVWLDR